MISSLKITNIKTNWKTIIYQKYKNLLQDF